MISFYLAQKNVLRKRERSLLTLVGMLLAVGCFVTLLSLGEGINQRVRNEFQTRRISLYVLPAPLINMTLGNLRGGGSFAEYIPYSWKDELLALPGVEKATGIVRQQIRLKNYSLTLWGIEMEELDAFLPEMKVASGRLPLYANEVMVGEGLSKRMELTLGNNIKIGNNEFKIVGIADAGKTFQDYSCFIPLSVMMSLQRSKRVQEFWLQASNPYIIKEISRNILKIHPDLGVKTGTEYERTADNMVFYAWFTQFCIAVIGLLIALTATMNTMLISTYERMKEFGTLRALGVKRISVFMMIILESLILSMGGGVLGIVIGVMGARMIDDAVRYLFQIAFPIAMIAPSLIFYTLLLSFGVGMLGAIIPGIIVLRKNIIESLRWE